VDSIFNIAETIAASEGAAELGVRDAGQIPPYRRLDDVRFVGRECASDWPNVCVAILRQGSPLQPWQTEIQRYRRMRSSQGYLRPPGSSHAILLPQDERSDMGAGLIDSRVMDRLAQRNG
jgi:hypothetical protein